MIYFAYGSNINIEHLQSYLAQAGIDPGDITDVQHANLPRYCLRTNYFSHGHCAGACNIEPTRNGIVEGITMKIMKSAREALRTKEGFPSCYKEVEILAHGASGEVAAFTYMVVPERRFLFDLPVTPEYRQLILDGAKERELSQSYQRLLRRNLRQVRASARSLARWAVGL